MTTQSEFIRNKIDEFLRNSHPSERGIITITDDFERDLRRCLNAIPLIQSYNIARLSTWPHKFVMSICWVAWDNDMDTKIFQYYDWRD